MGTERNENGAAAEPEVFPLDDATIESVSALSQQARDAQVGINTLLNHFARVHKLPGNWTLSPNGRELIKAQSAMMQQP